MGKDHGRCKRLSRFMDVALSCKHAAAEVLQHSLWIAIVEVYTDVFNTVADSLVENSRTPVNTVCACG